jgi:2-keto-4-pentenoate hydratase/2-oxohepta-3-ene-1,7-dioic acid hydratase in catechol pathway
LQSLFYVLEAGKAAEGLNRMKLYLGLTESSAPHQTRIFGERDNRLIDLSFAYSAHLAQQGRSADAYDFADFCFPATLAGFLEAGEQSQRALDETLAFIRRNGPNGLRGAMGERIVYESNEIRLLPPFLNPEKSFVIGFSDKARGEALPKGEIPTAYYKLPQTFITSGAPIIWPKFSGEIDADACLGVVIGKAGRRISPQETSSYVAGAMLLIDITARDVNKREGLTTNNLLGKNFPSSTSLGPAFLPLKSAKELADMEIALSLDGSVKQRFTLGQCVFTIEQIIARWSILGIKPGDFFAIGASMAREGERLMNPVSLRVGAMIRCSSPGLGELSHQVVPAGGLLR